MKRMGAIAAFTFLVGWTYLESTQDLLAQKDATQYEQIDGAVIYDHDPSTKLGDNIFGTVIADFKNDAPGRCSHGGPVCMEYANGNIVAFYANTSDHNLDGWSEYAISKDRGKSWSQERRVVGKAESTGKGSNPRFVVTSLGAKWWPAQKLYEQLYCARGEAENRIKEQQLELFADRTSTHLIKSNQLRLWFSSVAYNLLHTLRRVALKGTQWAKAQCQTIRLKLLKIGGQIRVSVRRVSLSLSEGYPYQALYAQALAQLQQLG